MDNNVTESWQQENTEVDLKSEEGFQYFKYSLSQPVVCTINFRCFTMNGFRYVKIVPVKCGEGHKYTQEGAVKAPLDYFPPQSTHFKRAQIVFEHATAADFERATSQVRLKIYFRGFPLETHKHDVSRFFSAYGKLEYLYIMAPSKTGPASRLIQGYVIFRSNDDAQNILHFKDVLFFKGLKILCEVYQSNKKNKDSPETRRTAPTLGVGNFPKVSQCSAPVVLSRDIEMDNEEDGRGHQSQQQRDPSSFKPCHGHNKPEQRLQRQSHAERPYLSHLDSVKVNSEASNIRFNVVKPRSIQNPNWVSNVVI